MNQDWNLSITDSSMFDNYIVQVSSEYNASGYKKYSMVSAEPHLVFDHFDVTYKKTHVPTGKTDEFTQSAGAWLAQELAYYDIQESCYLPFGYDGTKLFDFNVCKTYDDQKDYYIDNTYNAAFPISVYLQLDSEIDNIVSGGAATIPYSLILPSGLEIWHHSRYDDTSRAYHYIYSLENVQPVFKPVSSYYFSCRFEFNPVFMYSGEGTDIIEQRRLLYPITETQVSAHDFAFAVNDPNLSSYKDQFINEWKYLSANTAGCATALSVDILNDPIAYNIRIHPDQNDISDIVSVDNMYEYSMHIDGNYYPLMPAFCNHREIGKFQDGIFLKINTIKERKAFEIKQNGHISDYSHYRFEFKYADIYLDGINTYRTPVTRYRIGMGTHDFFERVNDWIDKLVPDASIQRGFTNPNSILSAFDKWSSNYFPECVNFRTYYSVENPKSLAVIFNYEARHDTIRELHYNDITRCINNIIRNAMDTQNMYTITHYDDNADSTGFYNLFYQLSKYGDRSLDLLILGIETHGGYAESYEYSAQHDIAVTNQSIFDMYAYAKNVIVITESCFGGGIIESGKHTLDNRPTLPAMNITPNAERNIFYIYHDCGISTAISIRYKTIVGCHRTSEVINKMTYKQVAEQFNSFIDALQDIVFSRLSRLYNEVYPVMVSREQQIMKDDCIQLWEILDNDMRKDLGEDRGLRFFKMASKYKNNILAYDKKPIPNFANFILTFDAFNFDNDDCPMTDVEKIYTRQFSDKLQTEYEIYNYFGNIASECVRYSSVEQIIAAKKIPTDQKGIYFKLVESICPLFRTIMGESGFRHEDYGIFLDNLDEEQYNIALDVVDMTLKCLLDIIFALKDYIASNADSHNFKPYELTSNMYDILIYDYPRMGILEGTPEFANTLFGQIPKENPIEPEPEPA